MTEPDNPPKEPRFIEKYYYFGSNHNWKEILKISTDRLVRLGCECSPKKFSLHCTFYNEDRCVCMLFNVNIFTSRSSKAKYLVEFQRQSSGDLFEIGSLYGNFVRQDEGFGMVIRGKNDVFLEPQRERLDPFGPVILSRGTLECLVRMLKSEYYNVRIEALVALGKCIQTDANRVLVHHYPSMFSILETSIDAKSHKITHPALIILKFMLKGAGEGDAVPVEARERLSSKLAGVLAKKLENTLVKGGVYTDLIRDVAALLKKRGGYTPP